MFNKFQIVVIITLLALYVTSCNKSEDKITKGQVTDRAENASIQDLITTPDRFAGKLVRVTGVMVLEFEGDAVYLSGADAERRITKNGIWLRIDYPKLGIPEIKPSDPEQLKEATYNVKTLKEMDGKFVVIEGFFDSRSHGHLGLYSGTLNVARMPHLKGVGK